MKKDLLENMKEKKEEQPAAVEEKCCAKKAKGQSDAVCAQKELPDDEVEQVAGGRSIIIHN